jgi:DNA-binding response OmpR family regulator
MSQFRGKKVMVVDDDADLCGIIAEELAELGFDVVTANSGNKGLALLKQTKVDLVISDVKMPDGTGIDLLRNIRTGESTPPVVIMMTGFSDFKEAEMITLGAACVWRKPFSFASAIPVLERLLRIG